MNGIAGKVLIAVLSAAIFVAMPVAGQSDASSITLQWSVSEACGENSECRSAVEQQFEGCLGQSPYAEFLQAETEERESYYLALTMQALAACIVDGDGEPYFETRDEDGANSNEPGDDDAP
jgi:hypothetical protein